MKPAISAKFVAAIALAAAVLGAASSAHARSNVYVSIGVQGVPVYVEPAPVYTQPQPVYVLPRVYAAPAETYARPCPPSYDSASAYEEEWSWRRAERHRRDWRRHHDDWGQQSRGRNWD